MAMAAYLLTFLGKYRHTLCLLGFLLLFAGFHGSYLLNDQKLFVYDDLDHIRHARNLSEALQAGDLGLFVHTLRTIPPFHSPLLAIAISTLIPFATRPYQLFLAYVPFILLFLYGMHLFSRIFFRNRGLSLLLPITLLSDPMTTMHLRQLNNWFLMIALILPFAFISIAKWKEPPTWRTTLFSALFCVSLLGCNPSIWLSFAPLLAWSIWKGYRAALRISPQQRRAYGKHLALLFLFFLFAVWVRYGDTAKHAGHYRAYAEVASAKAAELAPALLTYVRQALVFDLFPYPYLGEIALVVFPFVLIGIWRRRIPGILLWCWSGSTIIFIILASLGIAHNKYPLHFSPSFACLILTLALGVQELGRHLRFRFLPHAFLAYLIGLNAWATSKTPEQHPDRVASARVNDNTFGVYRYQQINTAWLHAICGEEKFVLDLSCINKRCDGETLSNFLLQQDFKNFLAHLPCLYRMRTAEHLSNSNEIAEYNYILAPVLPATQRTRWRKQQNTRLNHIKKLAGGAMPNFRREREGEINPNLRFVLYRREN